MGDLATLFAIFLGGVVMAVAFMLALPGVSPDELRWRLVHAAKGRRFYEGVELPGMRPALWERLVLWLLDRERPER